MAATQTSWSTDLLSEPGEGERVCLDSQLVLRLWVSVLYVVRYGANVHRPAAITQRKKGRVIFPSVSGSDKSDIPRNVKSGCDLSPVRRLNIQLCELSRWEARKWVFTVCLLNVNVGKTNETWMKSRRLQSITVERHVGSLKKLGNVPQFRLGLCQTSVSWTLRPQVRAKAKWGWSWSLTLTSRV